MFIYKYYLICLYISTQRLNYEHNRNYEILSSGVEGLTSTLSMLCGSSERIDATGLLILLIKGEFLSKIASGENGLLRPVDALTEKLFLLED